MKTLRNSVLGLLGCALLLCGCEASVAPEPTTTWPEGTAIVVGSLAIPRAEIEATADALALVNPVHTRRALRREALIAQILPRAAVRLAVGELVEEVRLEAAAALAILNEVAEGTPPEIETTVGHPVDLGFNRWVRARELELNQWSGPFEGVGNWFLLRVLERGSEPGEARAALETYTLEWVSYPFMPPTWDNAQSQAILASAGILAIQPELTDSIPYEYRRAP